MILIYIHFDFDKCLMILNAEYKLLFCHQQAMFNPIQFNYCIIFTDDTTSFTTVHLDMGTTVVIGLVKQGIFSETTTIFPPRAYAQLYSTDIQGTPELVTHSQQSIGTWGQQQLWCWCSREYFPGPSLYLHQEHMFNYIPWTSREPQSWSYIPNSPFGHGNNSSYSAGAVGNIFLDHCYIPIRSICSIIFH